ncbi:MAG: translocation/assembly module TamB domain-containing protein [Alphaproteobacteria bacterium]|nr:translocation/assembly module TamB domain-containing protein [Alphaproteobacteria bacterium]
MIVKHLSYITIPININMIPNISFQVRYKLFDNKVMIDKLTVYNKKIYVEPFAVHLFKDKIKKLYLNTKNGFIAINNLNIYNIKNSPIDVEIKNINLQEILRDDLYKDSNINGKVSLKIDGNNMKCRVKDFIIKNVIVNDISIGHAYITGDYETTNVKQNIKCNIDELTVNNIKIKNNNLDALHFSGYYNSSNIQKDIDCNIKELSVKNVNVNNNSVDNIYLIGIFKSNDINKDINCNIKNLIIKKLKVNDNSVDNVNLIGSYNSTDIKKELYCNIKNLIVNNIKIKNNSANNIHLIGIFKSNDIYKDMDCNIRELIARNIKIDNKSIGKLPFSTLQLDDLQCNGYFNSSNINKSINCQVNNLDIKNIKIDSNSLDNLHFSGSYTSSDIKRYINCNIKDLSINNINVYNNIIDYLYFNGLCNSNNITQYIDCKINDLVLNNVKVNNINLGDIKLNGLYQDNNINCNLELPNLKHSLSCIGKIMLNKNPNLDVILKSNTPLTLKNFKIKDNTISTNCQYHIKLNHNNKHNSMNLDIKTSNNIIKGINLGNISLQGNYENNKIQCKLDLNKWHHTISCNGTLLFDKELKYNLDINSNTPLVLSNLPVSKNLPININSTYKFNIQSNKNLDINGNLKLYDSSISQYLNNINANINIINNMININTLNANIPSFVHGKLEISGNVDLNPNNMLNTKCNIKLINGVITNIPVVKGTINANLNLTGNIIKDPLLKGDIIIKNPNANLTPVLSGAMLSTQIIEKFLNKKPKDDKNKTIVLSPINTDINIKIDKILEANGPGLETTWHGGASIQCVKENPINWKAKLSLIKGKYIIASKKLKLTSGECISNPNIKGLFTLMLSGRKKSNNDVVELKFLQQQNNTQIEFLSQPMKSKQDILALLLFDKYSSELSSSELYSLGNIIQCLSSGKGSIFSKVHNTLKIDSIELKDNTDESGEEYKSISVGKKIGKWKINLERGNNNESTKLSAERKILKNFKANIGVSKSGLESSIMWSKRY